MMLFASIADGSVRQEEVVVEDALLLRVAAGNKLAFTTLYRRVGRSVYAYALSVLKDPAEAEDVMQDTFLKLRSSAPLYRPEGKPMAWIMTIAKNICLMRIRQQRTLLYFAPEERFREEAFTVIPDVEDRIVLQAALRTLTDEECQIIVLHAVTGWKHREIAQLLELPLSTVLSKYRRGLKKLRAELEGTR